MEQNQVENQSLNSSLVEPDGKSDNSSSESVQNPEESSMEQGQSVKNEKPDPSTLILGKFKSQEDLIKAYQDLEKLQGSQSAELGELRQNAGTYRDLEQLLKLQTNIKNSQKELQEAAQKYNTPEYFQDPSFREIYKQAYLALGSKLDTDLLVNLLEGYVSGRISAYNRTKSAEAETNKALDSVHFDKNKKTSFKAPGKSVDEMTPQEINDLLDRLI